MPPSPTATTCLTFLLPVPLPNIHSTIRPPCHFSKSFLSPLHLPANLKTLPTPLFLASIATNGLPKSSSTSRSTSVPLPHRSNSQSTQQPSPPSRFLRLLFSTPTVYPALFAALLGSVCSVTQPFLFGKIVGLLSRIELAPFPGARRQLFNRIALLAFIYCIEVLSTLTYVRLITRAVDKAIRSLRELVFAKSLKNDIGFFDKAGRSHVERALSTEIVQVRQAISSNLSRDRGLRACSDVVLGIILNLTTTGRLGAPIFGIVVPILSVVVSQMGLRNGRIAARMNSKEGNIQVFLNEKLRGIRTLKAFGAERKERSALSRLLDSVEKAARDMGLSQAVTECANRLSIYCTIMWFFIMGGLLICAGKLSYEGFSCITGFIWILNFAMQGVSYSISDASRVSASLTTIYGLYDSANAYSQTTAVPSGQKGEMALPNKFAGLVRFEDVSFCYPSRPEISVLNGVNFSIHPGQMVALVGDSGGGKSTIAAMLSKFYAPTSGRVTLDGIDIQFLPGSMYSQQISLVDQDPILFQGTVRENIAYGLPDQNVSEEQIIQAAKEANAHDFITNLQLGYDTVWSPSSSFSGGQRQRIAIARSLIKSPRVLVLDEATSALDQESERMVQIALERVMKRRTVLIIAHRLSTVRSADVILFVKGGQIVERGTYSELYAMPGGHFRGLVDSATEQKEMATPNF